MEALPQHRLPAVPFSQLATVLAQIDRYKGKHGIRKELTETHAKVCAAETPYGTITQHLDLTVDGELYKWPFTNPFAYLHHMTRASDPFGSFLHEHLNGKLARIAIYADEVVPGNNLRPDHGRKLMCFYWTFVDLPHWYRVRRGGWIFFGAILSSRLASIQGGVSNVFRSILNVFHAADSWDFERVGMRCSANGQTWHLKAKFSFFIGDEQAIKMITNVKGSSGLKPCLCCKNIVLNDSLVGPYFKHIATATRADFDPHTDASFWEMVDVLTALEGSARSVIAHHEKSLGLNFDRATLLWDQSLRLRHVVRPVTGVYWDWMHVLVASGGIVQCEINQLLRAFVAAGVPFKDIDDFCSRICWPSSAEKLRNNFFENRTVMNADAHIKGFASEMLTCVYALVAFIDAVVVPTGLLPEHVAAFNLLAQIVHILQTGDRACECIAELRQAIADHHRLYVRLYDEVTKPKLHCLWHIPDCLERWGANVNCFSAERKHRSVKAIARHTFYHIETHVTTRLTCDALMDLQHLDGFRMCHLIHPTGNPTVLTIMQALYPAVVSAAVSKVASTGCGDVKVGDIVWFREARELSVARVQLLLELITGGSAPLLLCQLDVFHQIAGQRKWTSIDPVRHVRPLQDLRGTLPCFLEDTTIEPIFPRFLNLA